MIRRLFLQFFDARSSFYLARTPSTASHIDFLFTSSDVSLSSFFNTVTCFAQLFSAE
jgi:hypothetical protein